MKAVLLNTRRGRIALLAAVTAAVAGVLVWRAPDLDVVGRAFGEVEWRWVAAAIGINLVSVYVRAIAWHIVLNEALPKPQPRHRHVFAAFCIGLLGNAVLPGRVGEVARVAVLTRHAPNRADAWPTILGTVFVHRLLDVLPTIGLVVYVIATARIPRWALTGVEILIAVGGALLVAGVVLAFRHRRQGSRIPTGAGRVRRLLHESLAGLRVLHSPGRTLAAAFFQLLGWATQLLAVWLAFRAFGIDEPLAAAGLVLLVVNVALAFPLWPGSVGLFQAAVALALLPYGIAYQHGFAYGIGLQAIEASVGVALGLLFLAREGISFAMLKRIPKVTEELEHNAPSRDDATRRRRVRDRVRERVLERVG